MKKFGAWIMIIGSVLLGLIGVLAAISGVLTLINALSGESSAYGMGYAAGQVIVVILIFAIAWKLLAKGKSLLSSAPAGSASDTT